MDKNLIRESAYLLEQDEKPEEIFKILVDENYLLAQKEYIGSELDKNWCDLHLGKYEEIYLLDFLIIEDFLDNHPEYCLVQNETSSQLRIDLCSKHSY